MTFLILPSVESAFQILSQISNLMFLAMYMTMFVAAIRLRYTEPDIVRPFKIPGGQLRHVACRRRRLPGALVSGRLSFNPPSRSARETLRSISASW